MSLQSGRKRRQVEASTMNDINNHTVARFTGSQFFGDTFLGLTPQALCLRLLRRLS